VAASLFVQVIVVPAVTVIVAGLNAIPWMKTSSAPGELVPVVFPPPVPVMFSIELLEQLNEMLIIVNRIPKPTKNLLVE
jgi:hypothetical protein